ncbi:MAG: hypothetical protein ACJAUH_001130 [Saprospiraceae bacterium]|jgi:hypothetical protein
MKILNLRIPEKLETLMTSGKWNRPNKKKLQLIFKSESRHPSFYDYEQIIFENQGVRDEDYLESYEDFLGNEGVGLGKIDIDKLLLIGDINVGEPFGLYFKDISNPILIFFNEREDEDTYWEKISESFDEFWNVYITK